MILKLRDMVLQTAEINPLQKLTKVSEQMIKSVYTDVGTYLHRDNGKSSRENGTCFV